ncbi:hypothetical protein EJ110_NYTH52673 [Nymphaea thermarum]|nr:hypothetical protein EJ110_NYTH52673 [Nymphaea thermarum]
MDFPRFNRKRPKEWVYKTEQYFICQEITEQHKIRLAKMYLEEEAMEWYCFWEEDFPNSTWDVFKKELLLRFGDTSYVNHEIELRNLKQTSTVQDYQYICGVKNRPVESKIAHFIGGLNEDIQIEMLRDPPTELRKCFALAKTIEEQFKRIGKINNQKVIVLLDTGATHNFLNSRVALDQDAEDSTRLLKASVTQNEDPSLTTLYVDTLEPSLSMRLTVGIGTNPIGTSTPIFAKPMCPPHSSALITYREPSPKGSCNTIKSIRIL